MEISCIRGFFEIRKPSSLIPEGFRGRHFGVLPVSPALLGGGLFPVESTLSVFVVVVVPPGPVVVSLVVVEDSSPQPTKQQAEKMPATIAEATVRLIFDPFITGFPTRRSTPDTGMVAPPQGRS
jgi:hypothetical protein